MSRGRVKQEKSRLQSVALSVIQCTCLEEPLISKQRRHMHCAGGAKRSLALPSSPQLLGRLHQRFCPLEVGAHHLVAVNADLFKQGVLRNCHEEEGTISAGHVMLQEWEGANPCSLTSLPSRPSDTASHTARNWRRCRAQASTMARQACDWATRTLLQHERLSVRRARGWYI